MGLRWGVSFAENFASYMFATDLDVLMTLAHEIITAPELGGANTVSFCRNPRVVVPARPNFAKWRHGLRASSVIALGLVTTTTIPSRAAEQWTGTASSDWFNASNWSAGVPTNATSTRIDTVSPNATVIGVAGAQSTGLRVGVFGTAALTIQNGGTVNNTLGIIGDQVGSNGTAIVKGPGSIWANSSDFYVGADGNGTLMIQNGGAVSNVFGIIGAYFGSTGAATVDGVGSTWTNSQDISVGGSGDGNPNSVRGTLTIRNGGAVSSIGGTIGFDSGSTGVVTVDGAGSTWTNSGDLVFGFLGTASGTMTISNGGAVSAATTTLAAGVGSTGTLNIGAAVGQAAVAPGTLNTASVDFGDGTGEIVFNHTATNYIFNPTITSSGTGTGSVLVEAGSITLTAISSYIRPTIIDGGTLSVNGSIAGSSVTVNAGGALGGNGTVGNTAINGGTLAPSNSVGQLTVNGNLSFTAASSYTVGISATNADRTNVTGTASLGGATVNANFAPGAYLTKQYTIVNATGGLGGTTFGSFSTNLPSSFSSSLSYDANNAYLDLTLLYVGGPGGLNLNQTNVANALTDYFNRTGGIPQVYSGLTGAGLTQASGETATGTQQTSFDAMAQFMGVMTDPLGGGLLMRHPPRSSSAGIFGPRASAARRPRMVMERRDRTTSPATITARRSVQTICFRPAPLRALLWVVAAQISVWMVRAPADPTCTSWAHMSAIPKVRPTSPPRWLMVGKTSPPIAPSPLRAQINCRHASMPTAFPVALRGDIAWPRQLQGASASRLMRQDNSPQLESASLCRTGAVRHQHLCAGLWRAERDRHPQRIRTGQRQILRGW